MPDVAPAPSADAPLGPLQRRRTIFSPRLKPIGPVPVFGGGPDGPCSEACLAPSWCFSLDMSSSRASLAGCWTGGTFATDRKTKVASSRTEGNHLPTAFAWSAFAVTSRGRSSRSREAGRNPVYPGISKGSAWLALRDDRVVCPSGRRERPAIRGRVRGATRHPPPKDVAPHRRAMDARIPRDH
jgi:hypothetical protein